MSEPDPPQYKRFYARKDTRLLKHYNLFAVKDGEECLKKVLYGTAYGALTGTVVSVYDIIAYTGPSTVGAGVSRWMFHLFPMTAMFASYSAVSCLSGSVRGKDDCLNHAIAGIAAGSVYGYKFKSQKVGWGIGFLLAFVGVVVKGHYLENISFFPKRAGRLGFLNTYNKSFFTERPPSEGKLDN